MRRVTLRPTKQFQETGTVTWSPAGSMKRYPIAVQRIFPDKAFDLVWSAAMQGEAIHFKDFAYVTYAKLIAKYHTRKSVYDARLHQFERDRKKLLWVVL